MNILRKKLSRTEELEKTILHGEKTLKKAEILIQMKYHEIEELKEMNALLSKNIDGLRIDLESEKRNEKKYGERRN